MTKYIDKTRKCLSETRGYRGYNCPSGVTPYSAHPVKYKVIEDLIKDIDAIQDTLEDILNHQHNRGQLLLTIPKEVTFAANDVYVKIKGVFSDGEAHNFEIDAVNNRIIFKGDEAQCFFIAGVSEASVNKACIITYGMYKNGALVPNAETLHTFPASARTSTLSIVRIARLEPGEYLEVWAKSSDATAKLTVATLAVVLWGNDII
jgi:hypothetical protein